jgi:hypothetical protein
MKIAVTILLAILLTFTQTPLGQVLKLPFLVEHFYKHKTQNHASLLEFLIDHYSKEHNDADRSEDKRLPFKSVILQNMGFAIVPNIPKADFSLTVDDAKKMILPGFYVPTQHLCRIFHPPRV